MIGSEDDGLLQGIGDYYTAKVREHGATARGVDWNGEESQALRFRQLLRVADLAETFTIGEVGCGYGAFVDHLAEEGRASAFHGVDISPEMVAAAVARHAGVGWASFAVSDHITVPMDFCIASGIFNVRLQTPDAPWLDHIRATLDAMDRSSVRGFAFNALTSYSDADKMRDYLYYADPLALFDHCKRHYARNVAVLHDYGLYEFTIVVRKDVG